VAVAAQVVKVLVPIPDKTAALVEAVLVGILTLQLVVLARVVRVMRVVKAIRYSVPQRVVVVVEQVPLVQMQ